MKGCLVEPYRHRIFLCTNVKEDGRSCCTLRGSEKILKALQNNIADKGLEFDVKVVKSGCLGLCEQGPNAIVYPEGIWYSGLQEEDIRPFVETQLIGGRRYEKRAWDDRLLRDFFDKKTARKRAEAKK